MKTPIGRASILVMVSGLWLGGQTTINGGRVIAGNWDAGNAASTRPVKTGTGLPANCNVGEQFFRTDAAAGQNLYFCTAANTWTQMAGGGSGGGAPSAAKYVVQTADAGLPNAQATGSLATGILKSTAGTGVLSIASGPDLPAHTHAAGDIATGALPTARGGTGADLSATGGPGQVLMQTTAGGPVSAATVASTDLSDSAGLERTANKNAASGYAGLDATGRIAKARAPAATVYTDAANTFTGGAQDLSSAAATLPVKAGLTSQTPATCTANKELYIKTDAAAGQQLFICNGAGNGWTLVGDGAGGGSPGGANTAIQYNGGGAFAGTTPNSSTARKFLTQAGNGSTPNAPSLDALAAGDMPVAFSTADLGYYYVFPGGLGANQSFHATTDMMCSQFVLPMRLTTAKIGWMSSVGGTGYDVLCIYDTTTLLTSTRHQNPANSGYYIDAWSAAQTMGPGVYYACLGSEITGAAYGGTSFLGNQDSPYTLLNGGDNKAVRIWWSSYRIWSHTELSRYYV